MTRLAHEHGAINLGQGMPDFAAPEEVKEAARRASPRTTTSTRSPGACRSSAAPSQAYRRWYGMEVDPESEVCVTCGSTEAMIAAFLGVVDPDDEVIVFEPFYENYRPDSIITGLEDVLGHRVAGGMGDRAG
jgi:aminotransferase